MGFRIWKKPKKRNFCIERKKKQYLYYKTYTENRSWKRSYFENIVNMLGLHKSKRISWASDVNLCQVIETINFDEFWCNVCVRIKVIKKKKKTNAVLVKTYFKMLIGYFCYNALWRVVFLYLKLFWVHALIGFMQLWCFLNWIRWVDSLR